LSHGSFETVGPCSEQPARNRHARYVILPVMSRHLALPLVLLAYLGLVGAQLSGLHMHVDDHGYSGAPHAAHSHAGGNDPHDHEHETDVKAVDLGTIASKHLVFLIAVALAIVMLVDAVRRLAPTHVPMLAAGRRLRWRPPLRGPPAPL